LDVLPDPIAVVGAAAAVLTAVAAAFRKVVMPMWEGIRRLAQAHADVIEGAQLAQRELSRDSGESVRDRVERINARSEEAAARSEEAAQRAVENAGRLEIVERQLEELRKER